MVAVSGRLTAVAQCMHMPPGVAGANEGSQTAYMKLGTLRRSTKKRNDSSHAGLPPCPATADSTARPIHIPVLETNAVAGMYAQPSSGATASRCQTTEAMGAPLVPSDVLRCARGARKRQLSYRTCSDETARPCLRRLHTRWAAAEEAGQPAWSLFQHLSSLWPVCIRIRLGETLNERLVRSSCGKVVHHAGPHGRSIRKTADFVILHVCWIKICRSREIRAYSRIRNIKPPGSTELSAGVVCDQWPGGPLDSQGGPFSHMSWWYYVGGATGAMPLNVLYSGVLSRCCSVSLGAWLLGQGIPANFRNRV